MPHIRRILSCSAVLAFSACVGMAVFAFVRHQPRSVIVGPLEIQDVSSDGARILTSKIDKGQDPWKRNRCPIQVWNSHTGRPVHEFNPDAAVPLIYRSPNERHVVLRTSEDKILLADWQTGELQSLDEIQNVNDVRFSLKGRWLLVGRSDSQPSSLVDLKTRTIRKRMRDAWPAFSADDRLMFARMGPTSEVTVWDVEKDQSLGTLPLTSVHFTVSEDSRLLIERLTEPVPAPVEEFNGFGGGVGREKRKDFRVNVWDLQTFKRRFTHAMPKPGNLETSLSRDGQYLALWIGGEQNEPTTLEMVDTANGKKLWSVETECTNGAYFSYSGEYVALSQGYAQNTVTMFETGTGKVAWQKPAWSIDQFARKDDRFYLKETDSAPLAILDQATGEPRATLPADFPTANFIPMETPDGKAFVIGGWRARSHEPNFWETGIEQIWPKFFGEGMEGAMVFESSTGRELFHVLDNGAHENRLSDDASTLITIEDHPQAENTRVIRVWDVSPSRAWFWAFIAGVGSVLPFAWLLRFKAIFTRRKP